MPSPCFRSLSRIRLRSFSAFSWRILSICPFVTPSSSALPYLPEYAPVESIADLKDHRDEFGGKIIGNEPGQGILLLAVYGAFCVGQFLL